MKITPTPLREMLIRTACASAILASTAIHLDLYVTGYHKIPTVGVLFLLQVVVGLLLGFALMFSRALWLRVIATLFMLGVFAGYLLSREIGLFGFHEVATTAGLVSTIVDGVAVLGCGDRLGANISQLFAADWVVKMSGGWRCLLIRWSVPLISLVIVGSSFAITPVDLYQQSSSANSAAGSRTIVIENFAFVPYSVVVNPGERIEVDNADSVAHTLTSIESAHSSTYFSTGAIAPGGTRSLIAPRQPGTYRYLCAIHNFMTGVITVR